MKLTVSDLASVARIQEQEKITKILGIIEYDPTPTYHKFYDAEKTIIIVGDHEWSQNEMSPTHKTVYDILKFSSELKEDDNIIVHCHAGISRSTAAALIILYDKIGDINKASELLVQTRPQAAPNRLICKLADELLETGTTIFDAAHKLNLRNDYKDFWNNKLQR